MSWVKKSGPTYSAFLYIPPTFLSKDQAEEHQTILSPGNIHLRVTPPRLPFTHGYSTLNTLQCASNRQ